MSHFDIAQALSSASVDLENEDFEAVLKTSQDITDALSNIDVPAVIAGDGRARPYSIVVVGYRPAAEHAALVEMLCGLNSERFEVLFVENCSESLFDIPADARARNLRVFRLNENLGVGVARNIAIHGATGDAIISLDDDGITDAASLEALITLYTATDAVAVRGKVVSRRTDVPAPKHYNPGDRVVQRYIDIEGLSIWQRAAVLRVGGFDPVLFGHEGVELTARLFPFYGPDAFLYQPEAVLLHEFSSDPAGAETKMRRYERLTKYIKHKNPSYGSILNVFRKAANDMTAAALLEHRRSYRAAQDIVDAPVSIITTCYNGAAFLEDFVQSLAYQSDQNFELIFVDDGSQDGSADLIRTLLPDGMTANVIAGPQQGRSAALNQAVAAASHDICLIADADDICLPMRVEATRKAFAKYTDAAMMGFMIFDVQSHARATRPFPRSAVPLSVRNIFGMPSPFPGFAFRKSQMPETFDPSLSAGVDCDWLYRNMLNHGSDGYLVPLNVTYYRTHEGQITASRRHLQKATSIRHLTRRHEMLLGSQSSDEEALWLFTGWAPLTNGTDYWRMHDYALKLVDHAHAHPSLDAESLFKEIMAYLDNAHLKVVQGDYHRLKKSHENTRSTLCALNSELDYARHSLNEIYASSSWRLTAPLRALAKSVTKK